jgi:isopentenyl-diphosphate delta-isomerase
MIMDTGEYVILVDRKNRPVGTMEKLEVHQKGLLHRAFSIFIFNSRGDLLIHRRALEKYHCGGLWSNTCCSHPRPDETTEEALQRKLIHEMGFTCELEKAFDFTYRSELDNGLIEYEYDEVFLGLYDGPVHPNPSEVMDHKFASVAELFLEISKNPASYTPWFRMLLNPLAHHFQQLKRA